MLVTLILKMLSLTIVIWVTMGMLQVCNRNLAQVWSSLLGLRELVLCDPPLSQSKKPAATIFLELQVLQLSSLKLSTLLQDNNEFLT